MNIKYLLLSLFISSLGILEAQTTVSASCGSCHKPVSSSSKIGDTCPHCGLTWGRENTSQTTTTNRSINNSLPLDLPTYSLPEPIKEDYQMSRMETVGKSCGKCGQSVSTSSVAGGTCPYCGARWGTEVSKTTTDYVPSLSSYSLSSSISAKQRVKDFVTQFMYYRETENAQGLINCYAYNVQNFYSEQNMSRNDIIVSERKYWQTNDFEKFSVNDIQVENIDNGYRVKITGRYTKDYRVDAYGKALVETLKVSNDLKIYYIKDTFIN
jgi:DNA-directed RNA polymerase subunit RPC12/RpoP